MAAEAKISAQQVLDFLDTWGKGAELNASDLAQRQGYRQAAAVLAGIDDLPLLQPVGTAPTRSAAELLRDDVVPVKAKRLSGKVMLAADIRRQALLELSESRAFETALRANPKERTGPIQARLESYLLGAPIPIEQQTLPELEDTLQVLLWLDGIPVSQPPLGEVRRRLDYLRLLAPFESLAGDAVFRGRQSELDTLRRYVGVLPPEAFLSRLARSAFDWIKPLQQPALNVFGPGGVGKSALVARFMLEHTRLPEEVRIPFAYLDFDRPTLDIAKPLTLCVEMIRQLHLQFPAHVNFSRLLEYVSKQAEEMAGIDQAVATRSALADLLGGIEKQLGPRPYVVTLDTFEEVQYRGEASAFPLWDMLIALQEQRPFLRVVVSGRAPVTSLRLAGQPAVPLEIGSLDDRAAMAFLQAQGIYDAQLASKIVGQVGGVPLSLKLAGSLIKRDGADSKGVRNLAGRSSFWFSASDEMIQGQLFERILGHIHNPQVERLAHPGLVLRRITPEVILNVLNEPCSLAVGSIDEARALFEELRNETALVVINQDEDAEELIHRPDLRRIMLKLLVQKAPAQVRDIHQRAVGWYSARTGLRARAEELYHRLQLREPVDKAALDDRSVRFSIQASMEELPLESQLLLASYGLDVSTEVLARADREQRAAGMAAKVEELLPYGPTSLVEARSMANSLLSEADGASPVYRTAARVALQQEDFERGMLILEQGLSLAIPANNTLETMELLRVKAWALRGSPDVSPALDQLSEYARRHQDKPTILQGRAQAVSVAVQAGEPVESISNMSMLAEIAALLPELSNLQIWELVPALGLVVRWLANANPELPNLLRPKLIDESGPFELATFAESIADRSLKMFLNSAIGGWEGPNASMSTVFSESFERLCAAWPYRILGVQPPYGSRGSRRLSEAL